MRVVHVETGARLHFGFLDLNGSLGRIFGGIGVGINEPKVVLDVSLNDILAGEGPDVERALQYAEKFLSFFGIQGGVAIKIISSIPSHVGLGSGTRLALAVGRALSVLFGIDVSVKDLAGIMGRSKRSSVGTVTFERGGFVLDGGHKRWGGTGFPPLLFHSLLPREWAFVVAIPLFLEGISGAEEDEKFRSLSIHEELSSNICRITLMKLLPSIVEKEICGFGEAVTGIQDLIGRCFSKAQGGNFNSQLSEDMALCMKKEGAVGIGQSSWGPTVYGITEDHGTARVICAKLKDTFGDGSLIFVTSCAQEGASVEVRGDRFNDL